jgi:ATP-dependent exoDNAse (exonuclease V) beta subunit
MVEVWQDLEPGTGSPLAPFAAPAGLAFTREALPYRLEFPSRLADASEGTGAACEPDDPAENLAARARGEVVHALMDRLSCGGTLPDLSGVAAALRRAGLPAASARDLAPQLLAEVRACLEDPVLRDILQRDWPTAKSEWLLEEGAAGVVRRGQMDRVFSNGREWWIVDYKTSRPAAGADWQAFIARETEKYRPQLLAYREMAARFLGLADTAEIRLMLYFTACREAVVL